MFFEFLRKVFVRSIIQIQNIFKLSFKKHHAEARDISVHCWGTRGIGALGKSELLVLCRSARYWRVAQTRNLWRHVNGVRDEVICKQDLNSDTYMNKLHTLFLTWCPFGNCDGIRKTLKCRKDSLPRHFFVVLQFSFFQIKKRLC